MGFLFKALYITAGITCFLFVILTIPRITNIISYTSVKNTLPSSTTIINQLPTAIPAQTTTLASIPNPIRWGAYAGEKIADSAKFELLVGHQIDMQAIFVGWGNLNGKFPSQYTATVKDKNKTLIIFWEPSNGSHSLKQPGYNYDSIINGSWDYYINSFSTAAKKYDGPIILVPFAEMNGNWDPWCGTVNGNSAPKFIMAWRHIKNLFKDDSNVKFAWDVSNKSKPDTMVNAIGSYYPGDEFVDYVGVDGFNYGDPWQSFDDIFSSTITQLKTYNKPIYILSMASAQGIRKAEWITDALTIQIPKHQIAGWVWFNKNKERNWLINSDPHSLDAFRKTFLK